MIRCRSAEFIRTLLCDLITKCKLKYNGRFVDDHKLNISLVFRTPEAVDEASDKKLVRLMRAGCIWFPPKAIYFDQIRQRPSISWGQPRVCTGYDRYSQGLWCWYRNSRLRLKSEQGGLCLVQILWPEHIVLSNLVNISKLKKTSRHVLSCGVTWKNDKHTDIYDSILVAPSCTANEDRSGNKMLRKNRRLVFTLRGWCRQNNIKC